MTQIHEPSNARSRRTRRALLAAMRALLEEEGFESLTMEAVARRAGVTRRTVYLHFGSRTELVMAMFDHIAEAEGLHESLAQVWAAPDAVSALDEWAHHLARYHPRLLRVNRALQRVGRSDPDAAAHREKVVERRLTGCGWLITRLEEEGRLSSALTPEQAVDMLWALISDDLIEGLLVDRGWSPETLARQLSAMFRATFVAADRDAGA